MDIAYYKQLEIKLTAVTEIVQSHMERAYAQAPNPLPTNHSLAQAGLKDGQDEVHDWLSHGEYGLAFDHLIYMITEADLEIPKSSQATLIELARTMGKLEELTRQVDWAD